MPLPHRWLTSLMTRYNGSSLMIDCGEGTQIAVKEKGWSFKPLDIMCFTHYHADHISGLPGILLTMGNAERTEPLTMIGPKGLKQVVNALRTIAPELPFPIEFIELEEPVQTIFLKGYKITAFKVNHNILCYGYTLEIERAGQFLVEQAKALEIPIRLWSHLQKGETVEAEGRTYTPDMVMGPKRKGIKVTYCTDTRPVKAIAEQGAHADLFICEGMYAEKEKEAKARQYKHMTFYEAARLAREAKAARLWLTHFSPSLVRGEDYMDKVREIFPEACLGKDGKTLELDFEESKEMV